MLVGHALLVSKHRLCYKDAALILVPKIQLLVLGSGLCRGVESAEKER